MIISSCSKGSVIQEAVSHPTRKLIKLQKTYEPISEWKLRKAKLRAYNEGPGVPVEKPIYHRVRLDLVKVNHFLDIINRPYFYQDVAYGTRTINSGRNGSFETLHKVVEELQKAGASPEWIVNIKERLNKEKKYLETDYKLHCKEDSNPCPDHCRVFALCDENDDEFKQECEYPHSLQCDACENLKSVVEEIQICVKNESQSISFYGKKHQEDIIYDFLQAKKHIFHWKAHVLRSENQDHLAEQDVLRSLDATSALITFSARSLERNSPNGLAREDQAGCYHNNLLIASIYGISQRTRVAIERYDFLEPQHGKDIRDRIICPMKQEVRRYCDEGHDIQSAADMKEALLERPVQGVTTSVCEVNVTCL
ncbi:hypothetical protein P5673_015943 [Acropora cervicornis]|uniref:Uncharacterized protein n=1 Tax=Acropora cervicornis TaxID=6130 RepID=A0AAD9V4Z1_ACRCE|nr:hypothetical protein P5673_015943 [Acropora cervicornis]